MDSTVKVGVIGDFDPSSVAHIATNAAIDHTAAALGISVAFSWVPTPALEVPPVRSVLASFDALWASPGSPYKSMDGALAGIRFAREEGWPFFAT